MLSWLISIIREAVLRGGDKLVYEKSTPSRILLGNDSGVLAAGSPLRFTLVEKMG